MDLNLEGNPITKMLGQESDIPHVDEVVAFLMALAVTRSVSGKYVSKFLRTLIRLYGAIAFVIPMMLGGLPSDMMKNMDEHAKLVLIAMAVDMMIDFDRISSTLGMIVDEACKMAYAIAKANACAAGYAAFGSAFAGSHMAPFLGAFVAVNGHRFIEDGIKAFNVKLKGDNDTKVAVCGGLVLYAATTQLGMSPLMSRALLAAMNISQDYVDYDSIINKVQGAADSVTGSIGNTISGIGGASPKRGRSSTPAKMKKK